MRAFFFLATWLYTYRRGTNPIYSSLRSKLQTARNLNEMIESLGFEWGWKKCISAYSICGTFLIFGIYYLALKPPLSHPFSTKFNPFLKTFSSFANNVLKGQYKSLPRKFFLANFSCYVIRKVYRGLVISFFLLLQQQENELRNAFSASNCGFGKSGKILGNRKFDSQNFHPSMKKKYILGVNFWTFQSFS